MAKKRDQSSTFLGGYSAWKGLLGIIAFPNSLSSDYEYTRFYTTLDGQWGHQDFEFDTSSITYLNLPDQNYKAWWLVGKRGEVIEILGGKPRIERIDTAGTGKGEKYGYIEKIVVIENELYICGYFRQVYKRVHDHWELISKPILVTDKKTKAIGFESIDGISSSCIYCVGYKGEIWFYDGKKWHQEDSPTNQHLSDVQCIGENEIWICGDNGIVIHGHHGAWNVIHDEAEITENWWSVEHFNGRIYLAGDGVIGKIEDGKFEKVDTGLKKAITTGSLHAKEGLLWSIGEENIMVFDGKKWKEIICPDNK